MTLTEYVAELPTGHRIVLFDARTAEAYAESGARVTARTGAL